MAGEASRLPWSRRNIQDANAQMPGSRIDSSPRRRWPPATCYIEAQTPDEVTWIKEALISSKVGFRSWYGDGVHGQPHFHNVSRDALDVTDRIAPMLIGLPVAPDLRAGDVARVVSALELGVSRSR